MRYPTNAGGICRQPKRTGDRRYGGQKWRKLARAILARDRWQCRVIEGCPRPATIADHIEPTTIDTPDARFYDERNLRASCREHNFARSFLPELGAKPVTNRDQALVDPERIPRSGGYSFRYHFHQYENWQRGTTFMVGNMSMKPEWPRDGTCPPECSLSKIKPGGYVERGTGGES